MCFGREDLERALLLYRKTGGAAFFVINPEGVIAKKTHNLEEACSIEN